MFVCLCACVCVLYRTSFAETLGVDLQSVGPLMKADVEADLLRTYVKNTQHAVIDTLTNYVTPTY